jgi:hypothetical protein
MHRKKPFSAKKKKQQLQDKRQRKKSQHDDDDAELFKPTSAVIGMFAHRFVAGARAQSYIVDCFVDLRSD